MNRTVIPVRGFEGAFATSGQDLFHDVTRNAAPEKRIRARPASFYPTITLHHCEMIYMIV